MLAEVLCGLSKNSDAVIAVWHSIVWYHNRALDLKKFLRKCLAFWAWLVQNCATKSTWNCFPVRGEATGSLHLATLQD